MRRNRGWRLLYWVIVFAAAIPVFFIFFFAMMYYRDGLCPPETFAQSMFRGRGAVFGGVPWVLVALSLSALVWSLVFRILPWSGARAAAMGAWEMSFGAAIWLRCHICIAVFVLASILSFWTVPAVECGSPEGLSQRTSGFSPMAMHRWSEVTKVIASCDLGRNRGADRERPFFVVFTFELRDGDEIRLDLGSEREEVRHNLAQTTSALRGVIPNYEVSQDARRCPYDVQQALLRVSFLE